MTKRRAVYVVAASDSSWPGVLGVHGSYARADSHHASIVEGRMRWYRQDWEHRDKDTDYTREHDPLLTLTETRLVWDEGRSVAQSEYQPDVVTVKTLRVWLT